MHLLKYPNELFEMFHCYQSIFTLFLNITDCGVPNSPGNGSVNTTNGTKYGNMVSFSCNTGFDLIGSHVSTCSEHGNWSTTPPKCQIKGTYLIVSDNHYIHIIGGLRRKCAVFVTHKLMCKANVSSDQGLHTLN